MGAKSFSYCWSLRIVVGLKDIWRESFFWLGIYLDDGYNRLFTMIFAIGGYLLLQNMKDFRVNRSNSKICRERNTGNLLSSYVDYGNIMEILGSKGGSTLFIRCKFVKNRNSYCCLCADFKIYEKNSGYEKNVYIVWFIMVVCGSNFPYNTCAGLKNSVWWTKL